MSPEEFSLLVYRNLKGELSDREFDLLNRETVASDRFASLREEIEEAWDVSGEEEIIVTKKDTEVLIKNVKQKSETEKSSRIITLKRALVGMAALFATVFAINSILQNRLHIYDTPGSYTLKDGSKVMLREGSVLEVPPFKNDKRHVILKGEAIFNISHRDNQSFTVSTDHVDITVLGTRFLVKDISDETYINLYEGKIQSKDKRSGDEIILSKGMKVVHNEFGDITELSRFPNLSGWNSGIFEYSEIKLGDAFKELELVFGKQIVISNEELSKCVLSGVINGNTLDEVMDVLKTRYKFEVTIDNEIWTINKGECL